MEPERVVIVGAGQTGRGMFGALFFEEGGYRITFADTDSRLMDGLREQGYYTVEEKDLLSGDVRRVRVSGFECVDVHDRDAYLDALARASYIATAVFPESFEDVASVLADMVRVRMERGIDAPVAVILGGNFVGLRAYFQKAIEGALSDAERAFAAAHMALATSKANRKVVNAGTVDGDRFALTGDNKSVLPVEDRLPFGAGHRCPSFFQLDSNVELSMIEKIWSENLIHCSLGFMGACAGYETVNEAIEDERIGRFGALCVAREPACARLRLRHRYSRYGGHQGHDGEVRYPVLPRPHRADRAPAQAQAQEGRSVPGPAILCIKEGIVPYFIVRAAAHGFCYTDEQEPESVEIARLIENEGVDEAVRIVCDLDLSVVEERIAHEMLVDAVREVACPRWAPPALR